MKLTEITYRRVALGRCLELPKTVKEIAFQVNLSESTVRADLKVLQDANLVVKEGHTYRSR